jgi:hypothetical protein
MIDAKNVWSGSFGVVADPELAGNDNSILKLRVAIDYAGREDGSSGSGYFDAVYFMNNDNPNAKFVRDQINSGNIKKGSQLLAVGRLMQDRWKSDGKPGSKVYIQLESLTYAGGRRPENAEGSATTGGSGQLPDF